MGTNPRCGRSHTAPLPPLFCYVPTAVTLTLPAVMLLPQPDSASTAVQACFAFFADCMQHTGTLVAATTFLSLLCDLVALHKRLVTAGEGEEASSEALQYQASKHALALLQRDWSNGV